MNHFNEAYAGIPPWDIGRPQHEMVRLTQAGQVRGDVLDAGCGTGENALYLASLGHEVLGIDAAPLAIEKATEKARWRGVRASFALADALRLERLSRTFDTVIDCGLFHIFSDEERPKYARSLAAVLKPGGLYHVLCFSEEEPEDWGGPRRVTQAEIRASFSEGWRVAEIRSARFETNFHADGGKAWLATITRRVAAARVA